MLIKSNRFFVWQNHWLWTLNFISIAVIIFGVGLIQKNTLISLFLPQAVFVEPAGHFFTEPTTVTLSSPLSGNIYYTTDGSTPTTESNLYTQPIEFSESSILHFAVFMGNHQITPTQSHDLFIGPSHTIGVVAISTDPEHLWDREIGIYTPGNHNNHLQEGKEWERPAHVRFYEADTSMGFQHTIGLRLHGHALRGMPQKSFRLYFHDENGSDQKLFYPLFDPAKPEQFSSLVLRNGDPSHSLIREQLANTLIAESSSLGILRSRPVVVYLNGKYWGLYFLTERYDENYFSERYRFNSDFLTLLNAQLGTEIKGELLPDNKRSQKDAGLYNHMVAETKKCRDCVSYETLNNTIDVSNLIDYYIFELYFGNADWPYNNLKAWRYQTDIANPPESALIPELDGRFRFLFFDIDAGFGSGATTYGQMQNAALADPYGFLIDESIPFRNIFFDPSFQEQYQNRVTELVTHHLTAEHSLAVIDELSTSIRPEIIRHTQRWDNEVTPNKKSAVKNLANWENEIELLKLFVQDRPKYFLKNTDTFFDKIKEESEAKQT